MSRPLLLDLFCGAGGAAKGYHNAGFDIVGVDINPQPHYPYRFIQADAIEFLEALLEGRRGVRCSSWHPRNFAAIHASPPCQRFSDLAHRNGNAGDWPDLIEPIRSLLIRSGMPYVIENVEGAPLHGPTMLCGTMFPDLRVLRHRLFETNWQLDAPPHGEHPLVFTHDKRKGHYGEIDQDTSYVQVTGGGNCTVANKRSAMGTPWMTGKECNEAIPPAYAEYIGRQLLNRLHS